MTVRVSLGHHPAHTLSTAAREPVWRKKLLGGQLNWSQRADPVPPITGRSVTHATAVPCSPQF